MSETPSVGLCRDCRHWGYGGETVGPWRGCFRLDPQFGCERFRAENFDGLANVETREDFGCVEFEAREEAS